MHRRHALTLLAALAAAPALAGGHGRIGTFAGINGHSASGRTEIVGSTIHLLDDFAFDGAPDARVALGRDGAYAPETLTTPLANDTGASSYDLPAGIDPAAYDEVWIWCEEFSVGLAVAPLP